MDSKRNVLRDEKAKAFALTNKNVGRKRKTIATQGLNLKVMSIFGKHFISQDMEKIWGRPKGIQENTLRSLLFFILGVEKKFIDLLKGELKDVFLYIHLT